MTLPVEMKHPTLNRKAFQDALDRVKTNADGLEVRTRSEVQLEHAEKDFSFLVNEGKEIRDELEFVKKLEEDLAGIRRTLEVNEADNATARRGLLAQINALRESGIETHEQGTDTTSA